MTTVHRRTSLDSEAVVMAAMVGAQIHPFIELHKKLIVGHDLIQSRSADAVDLPETIHENAVEEDEPLLTAAGSSSNDSAIVVESTTTHTVQSISNGSEHHVRSKRAPQAPSEMDRKVDGG